MAAATDAIQTITRLTPLAEVLAIVAAEVTPVAPRTLDVAMAAGRVLAADAIAPSRPDAAMALQDGWALAAEETVGAGGYAPVLLMRMPQRVEAGQPMPARHRQRGAVRRGEGEQWPRRGAGHRQSGRRRVAGRRRLRAGHSAAPRRRAPALAPISPRSTVPAARASACASRASAWCRCAAAESSTAAARLLASDIERRGGARASGGCRPRSRRRAGGG